MGNWANLFHMHRTAHSGERAMRHLKEDCDPGPLLDVSRRTMADAGLTVSSPQLYFLHALNLADVSMDMGERALRSPSCAGWSPMPSSQPCLGPCRLIGMP
ncbi:MAG: hypothetical protein ACLSAF_05315 [Intestinimonas sp.]